MEAETLRRYKKRHYHASALRDLFNIPANEQLLDVYWDKKIENKLIVKTRMDYDEKEGDK